MTSTPVSAARDDPAARLVEVLRADPALREQAHRRLEGPEKARLALEILFTYARRRRRIRALALPDLLAVLRGGVVDRQIPAWRVPGEHVAAVRVGRAVARMLPSLPGDTRCLTQALVLTELLARRGIGSTLVISAAPGEEFTAHAWLEHGGMPVLPADGPGFGRLVSL